MGDDSSDSVHVYRAYYHDIVIRPGAARVDVSDVQLLRWYHKRVDVRKPTLRFSEFQDAFLELAPHYYHYEGDRIEDNPAIITHEMSPDPALTVAAGPDTGEDLSDHDDEISLAPDQPVATDNGESQGQQPASKRAGSPSHTRQAKTTSHRN